MTGLAPLVHELLLRSAVGLPLLMIAMLLLTLLVLYRGGGRLR